ncbi:MAG: hypothetical protein LW713_16500 [Acetobacteraceae bacterium]|jgi:hypothetical protein|nr:hypothetical protein [Roseomonas sp.]MCE2762585.1 hypothetical protein [Acetobacteraceae bacterium]
MLRVLVCIPHFFRRNSADSGYSNGSNTDPLNKRLTEFQSCFRQIQSLLSPSAFTLGTKNRIANEFVNSVPRTTQGDVIVVSVPEENLLAELASDGPLRARIWSGPPRQLGYECRRVFARNIGKYDLFCFIEDDTVITDPAFFRKAAKFYQTHGEDKVLLPNRFEIFRFKGCGWRAFLDRPNPPSLRSPERPGPDFLKMPDFDGDVIFEKCTDSTAGAYVITNAQLKAWIEQPNFSAPSQKRLDAGFDPMELTMIPMDGALPIYRPAEPNLDFLEVHHVPNLATARPTPRRKLLELLNTETQGEGRGAG